MARGRSLSNDLRKARGLLRWTQKRDAGRIKHAYVSPSGLVTGIDGVHPRTSRACVQLRRMAAQASCAMIAS
jgi:hypothetical protein